MNYNVNLVAKELHQETVQIVSTTSKRENENDISPSSSKKVKKEAN